MDKNISSPQDGDASDRELITMQERFTALQQQQAEDHQQLVEMKSVLAQTAQLCETQQKRIAELEEETAYWKKCLFGRPSRTIRISPSRPPV